MRDDPQGHAQAGVFDQLHDVGVRHADDGLAVHRQDPVPHLQLPAAVGWAALDDAADFVRHSCGRKRDAVSGGRLLRSARWLTDCLWFRSAPSAYIRYPAEFFLACGRCADAQRCV